MKIGTYHQAYDHLSAWAGGVIIVLQKQPDLLILGNTSSRCRSGAVGLRLRELLGETGFSLDVEIENGQMKADYVHLLASVPPHWSVSKQMQTMKGQSLWICEIPLEASLRSPCHFIS